MSIKKYIFTGSSTVETLAHSGLLIGISKKYSFSSFVRILYLLCNISILYGNPLAMTYLPSPLWTQSSLAISIHVYPYIYTLDYAFDSLSMLIYY